MGRLRFVIALFCFYIDFFGFLFYNIISKIYGEIIYNEA